MQGSNDIKFASVDELFLDPRNPRLGRSNTSRGLSQSEILKLMEDWTLDELAISYLESGGFWIHEALLATYEQIEGVQRLVVIEGNRRLAALKLLNLAYKGEPVSTKWKQISGSARPSENLFSRIPYIEIATRRDVEAFLGFRHVTGIKEWEPTEKAEFIAMLIDERGMTYEEVRRKIGSKMPTVRQNYIAYRLLRQAEDTLVDFPSDKVEERFSVMYLSIRTQGVQHYLQLNAQAEPKDAQMPVPNDREKSLENYIRWMFGDDTRPPLFSDSRRVDDFGKILESSEAVEYLESTTRPNFDFAFQLAGGDRDEIIRNLREAADKIEVSLSRVHFHKADAHVQKHVERLFIDVNQLKSIFPELYNSAHGGE